MSLLQRRQHGERADDARTVDEPTRWDGETSAWIVSLLGHLAVLVVLTLVTFVGPVRQEFLVVLGSAKPEDPLTTSEEFSIADVETEAIGASSFGDADALEAVAPTLAMTATTPSELEVEDPIEFDETIEMQEEIRDATGPKFAENLTIKGIAGAGVAGADGAVDRITQEIVLSLEERETLVVWFFDQSGSLERERENTIRRFDRVYEELGVIEAAGDPAFRQHGAKPLLTAVAAFGQAVEFLTPKPTDDLEAIKSAVASIKTDNSGVERTFTAISSALERYRTFRTQQPRRNVIFIVFTDEVGDDESELDDVVTRCVRHEIPVYCIGVPAPFGRRDVLVRYVDPDPKFDQTPQWLPVRQGPESYMPELVKIGSAQTDEPLASGFGPYSLTRLCYETGGIYFSVQPTKRRRSQTGAAAAQLGGDFDPDIMINYRPDYMPIRDYERALSRNKARAALVQAAQMSWVTPMEQPRRVFPKVSEAELANQLSRAQRDAAVLEPKINKLHEALERGVADREELTTPRWQAGFDLSMGLVLGVKVRTEGYNAMLAKAKSGMKFEKADSDTWLLAPSDDISVGSALEKMAQQARTYLERVTREHPDTPWAELAKAELKQPFGWSWKEVHTGVRERQQAAQNPRPRPPRNDRAKMLPRPVKRPPPKL